MTAFVEPLNIARVERGEAGEEAQFLFRTWRENGGIIMPSSQMNYLSPKLMLFVPDQSQNDVPKTTFVGRQTTLRRFFPEAAEAAHPTRCLPIDYRQRQASGYSAAIAGEPWYDIQRTGDLLGRGAPDLTLERLILKFGTSAGFERLFCLIRVVTEHQRRDLSNPEHRQPCSQQRLGYRLAKLDRQTPNLSHECRRA
ncbi:hypothetical protein JM93_01259 [Roseibium hamelinense]|uniref:Uncharacterized protein n=1 Tax=Roseibium hamelinense TaxID=150831 RepID=A0A562T9I0_9HYPH|nr:hypothetical protein JM93_01259 [Roseibium hamelinense]